MKYIWLGIKDYCKDCWHDWLLERLQATYPNATIYFYDHGYDADFETRHNGPITVEIKKRLTELRNSDKVIYIERTGTAKCLKNFVKFQSKHQ